MNWINHYKTSTVQLMKFGDGWIVLSHTLLVMYICCDVFSNYVQAEYDTYPYVPTTKPLVTLMMIFCLWAETSYVILHRIWRYQVESVVIAAEK